MMRHFFNIFLKSNKGFQFGILSLVIVVLFLYCYLPQIQIHKNKKIHQIQLSSANGRLLRPSPHNNKKYLVNSENCKILNMDPWDPSFMEFMKSKTKSNATTATTTCPEKIVTVSRRDRMFEYSEYGKKHYTASCYYRETHRVTQHPDDYTKVADSEISKGGIHKIPKPHEPQLKAPHEFLVILCPVDKNEKSKFDRHYEAIVFPAAEHSNLTKAKFNFWESFQNMKETKPANPKMNKGHQYQYQHSNLPPSVLIIGLDSVSRLHMVRSMPRTRKFMAQNDFVEMSGYTKIHDNTFGNVMGVLLGQDPYNYTCWTNRLQKLDDCPFIWKNFSRQNYVTAFIEDMPEVSTFNYEKTGFVQQPTDYYLRPMALDYTSYFGRGDTRNCAIDGGETQFLLKYIREFVAEMSGKVPYFLLSWFTSTSHDYMDSLQAMDSAFLEFFSEAIKTGAENTIIIYMSDHGYRYGKFRETFLGFYEEALPSFFIRLPPSVKKSQPDWYLQLKENRNRLTSPLDLHATLKDILSLSNSAKFSTPTLDDDDTEFRFTHANREPQFRKVYSFFEEMPANRSCASSGIPQDYCRCGVHPDAAKTSQNSLSFGHLIVDKINEILKNEIESKKCDVLSLSELLYARELSLGEGESSHVLGGSPRRNYVIGLEVSPSKARFEAKVQEYESGKFEVVGVVSRINSYGEMVDCGVNPNLRMYCSCIEFWKELAKTRRLLLKN